MAAPAAHAAYRLGDRCVAASILSMMVDFPLSLSPRRPTRNVSFAAASHAAFTGAKQSGGLERGDPARCAEASAVGKHVPKNTNRLGHRRQWTRLSMTVPPPLTAVGDDSLVSISLSTFPTNASSCACASWTAFTAGLCRLRSARRSRAGLPSSSALAAALADSLDCGVPGRRGGGCEEQSSCGSN